MNLRIKIDTYAARLARSTFNWKSALACWLPKKKKARIAN
jgi:hypothetical protein